MGAHNHCRGGGKAIRELDIKRYCFVCFVFDVSDPGFVLQLGYGMLCDGYP